MRRKHETRSQRVLARTLAGVIGCLLAGGAGAAGPPDNDDENAYHDLTTLSSTVELGTLYNSSNEFKFGDYTGLTDRGWSVLGNTDIQGRSPYDAESPYYYRLRSVNLGLDSRYMDAEYKQPGLFGVNFLFNEMPKYQTDSAKTFFKNTGSQFLELPPGWDPGSNGTPAQMSTLESDLRNLQIDHKRRKLGGGFELVLPKGFDFDANYTHETKRGEKLVGAVMGLNGGNPRSVVVPEPLDFVTHQINSTLGYSTEDLQLQLQYYASGFQNDSDFLRWEVPYTRVSAWALDTGFPPGPGGQGQGLKGGMPDNWFHQIVGSGGLNLPYNSRVMVNGAFGWGTQDDAFLPYTVNEHLDVPRGLPRHDLDGMLKTRTVTFRFVSKPAPRYGVNIGYRWNNRDNDSPVNDYYRVVNDSGNQNDESGRNRPYSFQQHKFDANFSYDVFKRTKLTLLYKWDRTNRNLQEVLENDEHSFGFKLVSHEFDWLNAVVRYERSYRDGSEYSCVKPLMVHENGDFGCGEDEDWENHPDVRKYYMANRRRDDMHAFINLLPFENLSFGPTFRYVDDDYYDSKYGLTKYTNFGQGVDLDWTPWEQVNFHAFYNYERIRSNMESISFDSNFPQAFLENRRWSHEVRDIFQTVGAGVRVDAIPDRLSFEFEYLYAHSRGNYVTWRAPGLTSGNPFPDEITELHDISVHGNLQITRNLSARLGYLFERYRSNDWSTEKVCPGCLNFSGNAAVIASGENSADYNAHVVSMSMQWEFW